MLLIYYQKHGQLLNKIINLYIDKTLNFSHDK